MPRGYAHDLYANLRALDATDADAILIEAVPDERGMARGARPPDARDAPPGKLGAARAGEQRARAQRLELRELARERVVDRLERADARDAAVVDHLVAAQRVLVAQPLPSRWKKRLRSTGEGNDDGTSVSVTVLANSNTAPVATSTAARRCRRSRARSLSSRLSPRAYGIERGGLQRAARRALQPGERAHRGAAEPSCSTLASSVVVASR